MRAPFFGLTFLILLSLTPVITLADVIIESEGVLAFSGVTPNTIEDQPDVGDTNIFVGRLLIINGIVTAALDGGLIVNAETQGETPGESRPTAISTDRSIFVGAQAPSLGILTVEGNGSAESASVTVGQSVYVGGTAPFTNNRGGVGEGVVDVSSGGSIVADGLLIVGQNEFSETDTNGNDVADGTVLVDGATSRVEASGAVLGDAPTGTSGRIEVTGGAELSLRSTFELSPTEALQLGELSISENSAVLIDGPGSLVEADSLSVGFNGGSPDDSANPENSSAIISITNGGALRVSDIADTLPGANKRAFVGIGARGAIEVDGAGSTFSVGNDAAQTVDLYLGASDVTFDPSTGRRYFAGDGRAIISNSGRLLARDDIYVGGDQSRLGDTPLDPLDTPISSGLLEINNSGVVEANRVIIERGGTVRGSGGLIAADVELAGGTLSPGLSPGTLQINGDLDLLDGILELEWFGPTTFDLIDVSGAVTFGPDLMINLIFGSEPLDTIDLTDLIFASSYDVGSYDFASQFDVSFASGVTGGVAVSFLGQTREFVSVPEPSTLPLLCIGLLVIWRRGRGNRARFAIRGTNPL